MCLTSGEHGATAESIFSALKGNFQHDRIPFKNGVSLSVDNTVTYIGYRNSLTTSLAKTYGSTFMSGFPCHLAHITASEGNDGYTYVTGHNVEDMKVDLFYWFEKSS